MKKISLILVFLLIPIIAQARLKEQRWQNAGWGGGGQYVMVVPDSQIQDRLYLLGDVSGQWLSTDGGATWDWTNGGEAYLSTFESACIIQDPANPDVMWQLGQDMLKSTDRGATWTATDETANAIRPSVHKGIAINPNNSDDVLYGNNGGFIRRTTDGGSNWSTYGTPYSGNLSYVFFSPDGSRLFVGEQDEGFGYYDIDDTDTFTPVSLTGTNTEYSKDYCTYTKNSVDYMCVGAGTKIACSSDQGDNWSYTSDTGITSSSHIWRIDCTVDDSNNVRFALSYRLISSPYTGGFLVSTDGGTNWTSADANYTFDTTNNPTRNWNQNTNPERGIRYDPFDADTLYKNDDWSVYKSTDHGATWDEIIIGAQITVVTDLAISPNNRLFASSMDNGLLYSDNWGETWNQTFPDGTIYDDSEAGHIWQVTTTGTLGDWQAGNGRVIATSTYWADFKPRVIWSEDNGATWSITNTGLPDAKQNNGNWTTGYNRSLTVDPQNESIIYMGLDGWNGTADGSSDDGGIFKSTDGGETWSRVNQPSNWQIYNCLQVDPNDQDSFYYGTFASHAYYTTDAGANYTQRTGIPYVYDCLADSSGAIYVSGDSGGPYLMKANTFSGSLFEVFDHPTLTFGGADGIAINPDNNNEMILGVYGRPEYWITHNLQDASPIWENITYGAPSLDGTHDFLFAPDCGTDGCIFAATQGAGVLKLDLQPLDGVTFEGTSMEGIGWGEIAQVLYNNIITGSGNTLVTSGGNSIVSE